MQSFIDVSQILLKFGFFLEIGTYFQNLTDPWCKRVVARLQLLVSLVRVSVNPYGV